MTTDRTIDAQLEDSFPASDPPSTSPVVALGAPDHAKSFVSDPNPQFGVALSSEECTPQRLIQQAQLAERIGLDFVAISDHFHPWLPEQGNSPFVWSVIGGIAAVTDHITVGTGVTCPIMRMHPAIVAHASATAATMLEGRFFLGLGTGEALNELVTGERWPSARERIERLEEAIHVIRDLLTGDEVTHDGSYYTVSSARLYTRPSVMPPILVASSSPASAKIAGAQDGLITTGPDKEVFEAFAHAGGEGKPRVGQFAVCWDTTEAKARQTAHRYWRTTELGWDAKSSIPTPDIFADVTKCVSEDEVARSVICGPSPAPILERVQEYLDAGFNRIYLHQVGTRQEEFLEFMQGELLPAMRELPSAKRASNA